MATYLLYPLSPHLVPGQLAGRLARLNGALEKLGSEAGFATAAEGAGPGTLRIRVPEIHDGGSVKVGRGGILETFFEPGSAALWTHGQTLKDGSRNTPEFLVCADTSMGAGLISPHLPKAAKFVSLPDADAARERKVASGDPRRHAQRQAVA